MWTAIRNCDAQDLKKLRALGLNTNSGCLDLTKVVRCKRYGLTQGTLNQGPRDLISECFDDFRDQLGTALDIVMVGR